MLMNQGEKSEREVRAHAKAWVKKIKKPLIVGLQPPNNLEYFKSIDLRLHSSIGMDRKICERVVV